MKKTILTLLMTIGSLMSNAQDTIPNSKIFGTPTSSLFGVEVGVTDTTKRGFINPNITLPQRITDDYYIVHYLSVGYSFLDNKNDEYVFSYGIGIPLPKGVRSGRLYIYLIDAYHYRPDFIVADPNDNRDFRERRLRLSYRTNKFEVSTAYDLRHSLILGLSYSFRK